MAVRETVTISLPSELRAFVRGCVATGRYSSVSEVVRAALGTSSVRRRSRHPPPYGAPPSSSPPPAVVRPPMPGDSEFLAGPGEMAALMRAYDWTTTPLGKPEGWPPGLRTAVRLLLNSHHPMHIFWGPEATFFYNDGFVPDAGPERHPSALGRPASETWGEIWPVIASEIAKVRNGGGHTWYETGTSRSDGTAVWKMHTGPMVQPDRRRHRPRRHRRGHLDPDRDHQAQGAGGQSPRQRPAPPPAVATDARLRCRADRSHARLRVCQRSLRDDSGPASLPGARCPRRVPGPRGTRLLRVARRSLRDRRAVLGQRSPDPPRRRG